MNNLPHSAKQAKAEQSQYYFTGKPCKHGHVNKRYTHNGVCYSCCLLASNSVYYKVKADSSRRKEQILQRIKVRATIAKIEFNITVDDLDWVSICPVFGYELNYHTKDNDKNVSIDRINPNKGYVKGNVCVMSMRANRAKWNLSFDEVKKLYEYFCIGH